MSTLRRIGRDILRLRDVEAYAVAAVATVLAVLSLVGDVVGDGIRWAVVLAALGLLTYRIADPSTVADLDEVLHSRASFDDVTISSRLKNARCVWIYGPSAVNLLTSDTASRLRTEVLSRHDGVVRVVVLDPDEHDLVERTSRQLDDAAPYASGDLRRALAVTVDRLERMAGWAVPGTFEYGFAPFNPGFSLVAIDPHGRDGLLIVEFHGAHGPTDGRMHLELTRAASERWFVYWREQFLQLWEDARRP